MNQSIEESGQKPILRGNGGLAGTCPECTDGQKRDICPVCHKCIDNHCHHS